MNELKLEFVNDSIPGAAPVSENSLFQSVTNPSRAQAIQNELAEAIQQRHSDFCVVSLNGQWMRRACSEDPAELPIATDYDDGQWDRVFVPNNYGLEAALSSQFGPVYYRRSLAPSFSPKTILVFDAVDYLADVWLNGEQLGHHEGYFAPFRFDVSGKLATGSVLTVRVQDPFEDWSSDVPFLAHAKRAIKGTIKYHDSRPGGLPGSFTPGWNARIAQSMTTGGITGGASLRGSGEVQIDALFATPLDNLGAVQFAAIMMNQSPHELDATLEIQVTPPRDEPDTYGASIGLRLRPGANRVDFRTRIPNPILWWPVSHADIGAPALYRLSATMVVDGRISDERDTRFGLRIARVSGEPKRMVFNGRDIFVQAANYIPRQHFADVDTEFYRRDMRLAAAAHLNSFGVHGHLQCPPCYDAADEEGILMFQDFALQWHYDSGKAANPGFIDKATRQIAEMAYTYWNHPSIVYWAGHNEPTAMFIPGRLPDSELDMDNQVLDEALELRLREVEPLRHVHRASGIGDDLHMYDGSLAGGTVYGARRRKSWFVSEFGFWTIGPQAHRWNDQGWPPDKRQMTEWLSRLSFGPSTMSFAGLPERYQSLDAWRRATELYGAFLAKYQTEWFRINRGQPFNAYRWHFFADWWGWAGGGLLDVDRKPKATYHALKAASRPVLVCTSLPHTIFQPGSPLQFPIFAINELRTPVELAIEWKWMALEETIVIGADHDAATVFNMPARATANSMVAMPAEVGSSGGQVLRAGKISAVAPAESSTQIETLALNLSDREFEAGILELRWAAGQRNWYCVLAAPEGWFCGPGAFVVRPNEVIRLGGAS